MNDPSYSIVLAVGAGFANNPLETGGVAVVSFKDTMVQSLTNSSAPCFRLS